MSVNFFRNINSFFRTAIQNYPWSSELYLAFSAFSHNLQVLNRGNIYRYTGGIFTGIQGENLQEYMGNIFRYTGGSFTGIQGEYYRYTREIFTCLQV